MNNALKHPGDILRDLLVENEISQRELSSVIQIAHSHLHNILSGDRSISADIAVRLEAAGFETAIFWLEKQVRFELNEIKSNSEVETDNIKAWKEIQENLPLNYLRKHGIITSEDRNHDIDAVLKLYKSDNIVEFKNRIRNYSFSHFRKSSAFSETRNNVIAWSHLAEYNADEFELKVDFDSLKKDELVSKLRDLFVENNDIKSKVGELLQTYGIKFFTLDRPSKTPVDGKSFMSGDNPTIVLSLKYKRLDNFAYTLMHELGHVYKHLTKAKFKSESFFTNNTKNDILEFEADSFARNELIPLDAWNQFIQANDVFSDDVIIDFAEEINIHPAIVRGRVCYEYNNYYRRASNITSTNKIN